jgi:cytoskeletal protein CcmA (bactofilin family)
VAWKKSKDARAAEAGDWSGFLDKSVRLQGTLEFPGTFRVEGEVKGTIISSQTLMLGEAARVEGQIEGNHVMISGRFDGVIFAKGRVEIHAKGTVTGEIHAPCLIIEAGGIFDGQCHMLAASETAKPLTIPIRAVQNG